MKTPLFHPCEQPHDTLYVGIRRIPFRESGKVDSRFRGNDEVGFRGSCSRLTDCRGRLRRSGGMTACPLRSPFPPALPTRKPEEPFFHSEPVYRNRLSNPTITLGSQAESQGGMAPALPNDTQKPSSTQ